MAKGTKASNVITAVLLAFAFALLLVLSARSHATDVCVPPGRIDWAAVPEIAFISGVPEKVQLGPFMLDPANRWTPGDLTRASGWQTRFPASLTALPAGVTLNPLTLELAYDGTPGRQDAATSITANETSSGAFRIRVLIPTNVYGYGAAAVNAARAWGAVVCPASFPDCRKQFKGGTTDALPTVLYITPGTYAEDWYLGKRAYVYVIGDPATLPLLQRDELQAQEPINFVVRNLRMQDASVGVSHESKTSSTTLNVYNVEQFDETGQQNGLSNPNGYTQYQWNVYWWSSVSRMMGGTGNTTHAAYIEGRPRSRFEVNNVRFLGTQGSSAVKSTMKNVFVRNSLFCVTASCNAPLPNERTMHTPIDVAGASYSVIYNNKFVLWRAPTSKPPTYGGIKTGAIYWRLRNSIFGSDMPAYPDQSWDPPVSSILTMSSPGGGYSAGPDTFVSDAFWTAVRAKPINDRANPYAFSKYIGFNEFVLLAGGKSVEALRDDGTYQMTVTQQFGPQVAQRGHPLQVERSMSWLYDNTFTGYADGALLYNMTDSAEVAVIKPGAKWPRETPEEFPHYEVVGGPLPPWFPL